MALDNLQSLTDDEERKRKEAEFQASKSNILPGVGSPIINPEKLIPKNILLKDLNQRQEGSLGEPKALPLYEPPIKYF